MKAVVVERPNEVTYQEVEAPAIGADGVLVESHAACLCRTDDNRRVVAVLALRGH